MASDSYQPWKPKKLDSTGETAPPAQQPAAPAGAVQQKAYRAYSMQDAMIKIREELGPQAVIVSSRMDQSRSNPGQMVVEVVAQAPVNPQVVAQSAGQAAPAPDGPKIGGLGKQLQKIREVVVQPFLYPEMFERLGIDPPKGVLMYGPPGTGKTLIARTLADECGANFMTVNGPELMGANLGESEKNLREVFEKANKEAPSLIFFDEIDAVAGDREESQSGTEKRFVTQLLTLMDGMEARGRILILAATNRPDSLDPALRRPGRFDREVEISIPDKEGRLEILQIHTGKMAIGPDVNLEEIAEGTHGYVGADLASLCKEAGMQALREAAPEGGAPPPGLSVCQRHFELAVKEIKPSTMRKDAGDGGAESPKVTWDDVGGLEEVKRELNEAIILPLKQPEVFEKMGINPPKGVLMAGPPGTGKTLIAKAAAGECGVNFIAVAGPSLVSKFVGETEKGVRDLFARARQASPCIIFFDELDALAPVRGAGAGDNQFADRVVAQMLVEMDGFSAAKGIFCLAATNRPDAIDPALRRPGRFDKVVDIPLPDEESRQQIWEVHLRSKPKEKSVNTGALVKMSEGLSGAEIEDTCRRAAMTAVRNVMSGEGRLEPTVSQRDLIEALGEVCKSRGLPEPSPPALRALVLDDEAAPRKLACEALKLAKMEAVAFSDPEEALYAVPEGNFDLAVLDIDMPKMTGLEVLGHIRKILPNLPVIMATGRQDAFAAAQSFKLGVVDYITKPYKLGDLVKAAKDAIAAAG